ncbi:OB-fold nucleic acid binding domain-containing protein [Levilactobacillus brevis]|nr:OB-fold nucleic acid binding domain-containing protein [Levilactobacillus brevis]
MSELTANTRVTVLLYVIKIRQIRTKRGEPMAFVTGGDETADVSVTIFPNQFRQISEWLATDQVIVVRGKVERRRGLQIVADQVSLADQIPVKPVADQHNANVTGWCAVVHSSRPAKILIGQLPSNWHNF